jgi:hypothetical protein
VQAIAVAVGVAWLSVALLGNFSSGFILYPVFRSLGLLFWLIFTGLGVALMGIIAWSALQPAAAPPSPTPGQAPPILPQAWNPVHRPSGPTVCHRCKRTLPPWRSVEGTCTVCTPYSTFLRRPRIPDPAVERRRTTLFLLEGLGVTLLAMAFVGTAYAFPLALGAAHAGVATLAFLVFTPLCMGLILWMYARSQRHAE